MLKARLARFYGWTDREIESMAYSKVQEYVLCIEPLMAEETLVSLTVSSYPYQKKQNAQKIEKDLRKKTTFNLNRERTQVTTSDIYQSLMRSMGG